MPSPIIRAVRALRIAALIFLGLVSSQAEDRVVDEANFRAEFKDGWLVSWTNKGTGETFNFGSRDLDSSPASDDRHYRPGAWFIRNKAPGAVEFHEDVQAAGADAVRLVLSGSSASGVEGLQWTLRLPFDQFSAVHWPRGLAPARLTGKGALQSLWIAPTYMLDNRPAVLSTFDWRMRYYVIQGKSGGLVVYVNDPENTQANILEYKTDLAGEVTMSNRAMPFAPFASSYSAAPWIIRQYKGPVLAGAKIYQDYLREAYHPIPLAERPTAWVQDLGWVFVGAPWTRPLTFPGKPRPYYNYTEGWGESMKAGEQWLDNAAKVLDPKKTMFYLTDWRVSGHDTSFPETTVDPYFALMVGKAKARGFKVMLHFHTHLVQDDTAFFHRLVEKQSEWRGYDPKAHNGVPWGVGYDIVRNIDLVQRDKKFGTDWTGTEGQNQVASGYDMNPAYEAARYFKAAEILSAVRATNADAIHLDVPSVWMEGHNDRYGMNIMQGMREMFKLIRKVLDENGYEHVAIATELTPAESYFQYVDLAQNVRANSISKMLEGQLSGDDLLELQVGAAFDKVSAQKGAQAKGGAKAFDPAASRELLGKIREIHVPDLDAMVVFPWIRGYPHLGSVSPNSGGIAGDPHRAEENLALQALDTWYSLVKDTVLHTGAGQYNMFMDAEPWDKLDAIQVYRKRWQKEGVRPSGKMLGDFDYAKFAFARFWEATRPVMADLPLWDPVDLACYQLSDGRKLHVFNTDPLTLCLRTSDGRIVANLNIFTGWQQDEWLLENFAPHFLDNQLDSSK